MSRKSGGSSGRKGFHFQDFMAAYFFTKHSCENLEKNPAVLHIEKDQSDFHFSIEENDMTQKHFFESKYKNSGNITWSKFCSGILPNFADLAEDYTDEGWVPYFHIVSNVGLQTKLNSLMEDIESFRHGSVTWPMINNRHDRMFQRISTEIGHDPDSEVFSTLIWGLCKHQHTKEELQLSILEFLRKCTSTQPRRGRETILNMISDVESGVVHRDGLEGELGFDLVPTNDSTSWNKDDSELRRNAEELRNTFSGSQSNESEYREKKIDVRRYAEDISNRPDVDEEIVSTHSGRLETEFDKLIEAEKTTSDAQSNISNSIAAIQEHDDQTDSERDND